MNYPKTKLFIPSFGWNGLLIVGDHPYNENANAHPFMFSHAGTLSVIAKKSGLAELSGEPGYANVFSTYPDKGYVTSFDESYVKNQVAEFHALVDEIKPRTILFLGRQTCKVLLGTTDLEEERGAPFFYKNFIPAVMSFHPKEIFRQYEFNIIAQNDFAKVKKIHLHGWKPAEWNINYQPTYSETLTALHSFLESRCVLSADIETNQQLRMTCIGLCYNDTSAITIPLQIPGGRYWTEEQEKVIWLMLARVLEACPLVGQNCCSFDHYVLAVKHKILAHFVSDTMIAMWEIYCEMPKSLAFINSLFLMNPYWKDSLKDARTGKIHYSKEFEYNAKDTIICLQGATALGKEFDSHPPACKEHYRFNIRVSRVFQYMGMRGIKFDRTGRDKRLNELNEQAAVQQLELDTLSGRTINVRSPKQMKEWLYKDLKLPPKYKEHKDELGDVEMRETQDYLAILKLAYEFPDKKQIMVAAKLRKLRKRISTLESIVTRPDGIVGYSLNVVGTVTGRSSSRKPLDGFGIQAQNQDRRDRDLFLGDDQWLKADLEGADSWTVAAMLACLGDNTMMHDLVTGIKPAQALAIAYLFGSHLIGASAEDLLPYKKQLKEKTKEEELRRGSGKTTYDIMKAVSHGSNYGMGPPTMHDNIFRKSDGELYVPVHECKLSQQLYERRYKTLQKLHERMVSLLNSHGYLDAFSGNRRYFFGRRDNTTVREMLAQLPQAHTCYATNLLLERLYYWEGNRRPERFKQFYLTPANQVHDETDLMFKLTELDQVRDIFHKTSKNRITCWGVSYSIPFEANYGPNWAAAKEEL